MQHRLPEFSSFFHSFRLGKQCVAIRHTMTIQDVREIAMRVKSKQIDISTKGVEATQDDREELNQLRIEYHNATAEIANSDYRYL